MRFVVHCINTKMAKKPAVAPMPTQSLTSNLAMHSVARKIENDATSNA